MKVNREIKVPFYIQVYKTIVQLIKDKKWEEGEFLPSERELSLLFDVDRLTVRRALNMIVKEGLIEKKAGLGTRIIKSPPRVNTNSCKNILFLLPKSLNLIERITEPFYVSLFYEVEKECKKRGYSL